MEREKCVIGIRDAGAYSTQEASAVELMVEKDSVRGHLPVQSWLGSGGLVSLPLLGE